MQLAITYTTFVSTLAHTNAACFALLAQNPFLCTTQRSDFQSKSHPEWVETRHAMMISSYLLCIRHLRPSSAVVQIKQENNSNSTIGSQESDSTGASKSQSARKAATSSDRTFQQIPCHKSIIGRTESQTAIANQETGQFPKPGNRIQLPALHIRQALIAFEQNYLEAMHTLMSV